jgi:hypothetical protein
MAYAARATHDDVNRCRPCRNGGWDEPGGGIDPDAARVRGCKGIVCSMAKRISAAIWEAKS